MTSWSSNTGCDALGQLSFRWREDNPKNSIYRPQGGVASASGRTPHRRAHRSLLPDGAPGNGAWTRSRRGYSRGPAAISRCAARCTRYARLARNVAKTLNRNHRPQALGCLVGIGGKQLGNETAGDVYRQSSRNGFSPTVPATYRSINPVVAPSAQTHGLPRKCGADNVI